MNTNTSPLIMSSQADSHTHQIGHARRMASRTRRILGTTQYKSFGISLGLLFLAQILFALVFPNELVRFGVGGLAVVVLVPVSLLVSRISWYYSPIWGFLYGGGTYALFNMWLYTFAPASFIVVPIIYGSYFAVIFLALKLAAMYCKKYLFVVQTLIWILYEYWRTSGFLGYSFGVLGYAWSFQPLLMQTVDIFGIWGITGYLAFISFFIAHFFSEAYVLVRHSHNAHKGYIKEWIQSIKTVSMRVSNKIVFLIFGIVTIGGLLYGVFTQVDYSSAPHKRIALVQHSNDPWEGGLSSYTRSLQTLMRLSEEAMNTDNPPELVVWSETAFVPSITYHLKYREVPEYTRLIHTLMKFLETYPDTDFIIGNGDGIKTKNERGQEQRSDYNATLFFSGGELQAKYYKQHLVPFTEYFPYKKLFSRFYQYLLDNDVHFWLKGDTDTVFESGIARIATPICFEDGFAAQNARFVQLGANLLINVTNDAWSHTEVNALQHLQNSIVRAIENKRSMIRSTNSGMTSIIDPNGKIVSMIDSFTQETLIDDIPLYTERTTLYTRWKDWFIIVVVVCLLGIIVRTAHTNYKKRKHDKIESR